MFDSLTQEEKEELRRTLEWVLVATQSTPETRSTIDKVIELLKIETPVGVEDIHNVQ